MIGSVRVNPLFLSAFGPLLLLVLVIVFITNGHSEPPGHGVAGCIEVNWGRRLSQSGDHTQTSSDVAE